MTQSTTAAQPLDLAKQSFDERFSIDSHFGWKPLDYWRAGFDAALIAQARAAQPESATGTTGAVDLSDSGIVEVLASMGVDSEPSKFGFKELQVRTTVPTIRKVVERYLAAPASAQPDRGAVPGKTEGQ